MKNNLLYSLAFSLPLFLAAQNWNVYLLLIMIETALTWLMSEKKNYRYTKTLVNKLNYHGIPMKEVM